MQAARRSGPRRLHVLYMSLRSKPLLQCRSCEPPSALMLVARRSGLAAYVITSMSLRSNTLQTALQCRPNKNVPNASTGKSACATFLLMPLGKLTIISQAERVCAQKVPRPYSGAEEKRALIDGARDDDASRFVEIVSPEGFNLVAVSRLHGCRCLRYSFHVGARTGGISAKMTSYRPENEQGAYPDQRSASKKVDEPHNQAIVSNYRFLYRHRFCAVTGYSTRYRWRVAGQSPEIDAPRKRQQHLTGSA